MSWERDGLKNVYIYIYTGYIIHNECYAGDVKEQGRFVWRKKLWFFFLFFWISFLLLVILIYTSLEFLRLIIRVIKGYLDGSYHPVLENQDGKKIHIKNSRKIAFKERQNLGIKKKKRDRTMVFFVTEDEAKNGTKELSRHCYEKLETGR